MFKILVKQSNSQTVKKKRKALNYASVRQSVWHGYFIYQYIELNPALAD
jgi:hypothetical protein